MKISLRFGIFSAARCDRYTVKSVALSTMSFHVAVSLVPMMRVNRCEYMPKLVLTRSLFLSLLPHVFVITTTFLSLLRFFLFCVSFYFAFLFSYPFFPLCLASRTIRTLVRSCRLWELKKPRKLWMRTLLAALGWPKSILKVKSQVGPSRIIRIAMPIRWMLDGSVRCFRTKTYSFMFDHRSVCRNTDNET